MRRRATERRTTLLNEARTQAEADRVEARETLASEVAAARERLDQDAQVIGRTIADRLAGRSTH